MARKVTAKDKIATAKTAEVVGEKKPAKKTVAKKSTAKKVVAKKPATRKKSSKKKGVDYVIVGDEIVVNGVIADIIYENIQESPFAEKDAKRKEGKRFSKKEMKERAVYEDQGLSRIVVAVTNPISEIRMKVTSEAMVYDTEKILDALQLIELPVYFSQTGRGARVDLSQVLDNWMLGGYSKGYVDVQKRNRSGTFGMMIACGLFAVLCATFAVQLILEGLGSSRELGIVLLSGICSLGLGVGAYALYLSHRKKGDEIKEMEMAGKR